MHSIFQTVFETTGNNGCSLALLLPPGSSRTPPHPYKGDLQQHGGFKIVFIYFYIFFFEVGVGLSTGEEGSIMFLLNRSTGQAQNKDT